MMAGDSFDDDEIEALLSNNQVLINDEFDPVLKAVKSELGGEDEIELKRSTFKNHTSISVQAQSRILALHSAATTMLIWWVRHTPGERNISNESAVCAEQLVIAVSSVFILKSLSSDTPMTDLVMNHHSKGDNQERRNHLLNSIQVVVGALITIFSGFAFWAGVGHLDIIMCSAVWEAKAAFTTYFIAVVFWSGLIPNAKNLSLTCTQWLGIMLIIFGLIEIERVNRQEAHTEIALAKSMVVDSSGGLSSLDGTSEEAENVNTAEIESTKRWEATHHEGFITMFSAAILYAGNCIHAQMQVIDYKTNALTNASDVDTGGGGGGETSSAEKGSLIPKSPQSSKKMKKKNTKLLDEERKHLLLYLWSFILQRSIVAILVSFLAALYFGNGDMSIVFQGFDIITTVAIILNAFGNVYVIGLSIDLFAPVVAFTPTTTDESISRENDNTSPNSAKSKVISIPSLSSGISMIITLVSTTLFLGSSGINIKVLIGFGIAVYGVLLHGGALGSIGGGLRAGSSSSPNSSNSGGVIGTSGENTASQFMNSYMSLFAPSDVEEVNEVGGISNGQFIVNS